jgi:hypothetical protein
VIATLGRYDELQASGQLERLLQSGARFATKAMVLAAAEANKATKIATRWMGPALAFERLWQETGCGTVIAELAEGRGRPRLDPSGARAPARQRRQGAHWQYRLSPLSQDDQQRPIRDRAKVEAPAALDNPFGPR